MLANLRQKPLVSVLMSTHNCQDSLRLSVQSVIEQTYKNWELIIIDDASCDGTYALIKELALLDARIFIYRNKINIGLAKSLNRAISLSGGEYIARADCDDISLPSRIETQLLAFQENPKLDVVGSNVFFVDNEYKKIKKSNFPLLHSDIAALIHRMNPFAHSSILAKRSFFIKNGLYDERLRKKQDFDLWARGINDSLYANVPQSLVLYRIALSKPIQTDLYGFFVRVRNGYRGGYFLNGLYWAVIVLLVNLLRKFGYKPRSYSIED